VIRVYDKLNGGKEPNMTIEEILFVLEQNATSMLCGRMLNQSWLMGDGHIDDAEVVLLAKALRANTSLTALDLSRNTLSAQGAVTLADVLREQSQLRSLNFSFINLDEASLAALDQALTSHPSLTSMFYQGLHPEMTLGQEHLINIVSANTSLRCLKLRLCNTMQYQRLAETLQHLPQLTLLDMSGCDLNGSAVTALTAYVKSSKTLSSLNIAFSSEKAGVQKNALLEALKSNDTLTYVNLNVNCFSGQSLAEVLCVNTTLTSIEFYGNHLFPAEVNSVAAALRHNTSLRRIDLGDTQFHLLGIQALAEALTVNTTLTSIGLKNNQVSPLGAQAVAAALHVNSSLVSVNIAANRIGGLGAQAFAEALLVNTTLRTLSFEINDIDEVGIRAIMTTMKQNTSLTSLNVCKTAPENSVLQTVTDMLRVNTSLRSISMENYSHPDYQKLTPAVENSVHKAILASLQVNPTLINFVPRYGLPSSEKVLAAEFGTRIAKVLTRNRYRLFFIRSPHGLRNIILYSLFSKPLLSDLSPGRQLPHIIKFQLTQYAAELSLLDEDILGRAIMAGWCCGCGTSENLETGSMEKSGYSCSYS
jgi:Ran GTPase-activating protein (RanGAP) involved in mRNA processing and transport